MSNPQSKGAIKKTSKNVQPAADPENLDIPTTSRAAAEEQSVSPSTSKSTSKSAHNRRQTQNEPIELTVGKKSKSKSRGGKSKGRPKTTPLYRSEVGYLASPFRGRYQRPPEDVVAFTYADVLEGDKTEYSPTQTIRTTFSLPAKKQCPVCYPHLKGLIPIAPPALKHLVCWDLSEKVVFKFKAYSAQEVIELSDDSGGEMEPPRPSLHLEPPSPIQQLFSDSYSIHSWLGLDTQERRYPLQQRDPLDQLLVSLQNLRLNQSPSASIRDAVARFIEKRREDPDNSFAAAQNACRQWVLNGPTDEILITKFGLKLRRADMYTLTGQNWLNDLVMDFYMNLLSERSRRKHCTHGYPRVHSMNPYFMTNLLTRGYEHVMRYTRKVNLFQMDVIPVPVYLGERHWAIVIADLKNSKIEYYDPRGFKRIDVPLAIKEYLHLEAAFKQRQVCLRDVLAECPDLPKTQKCYDAGVYVCMYAEYMSTPRTEPFKIADIQYFRNKMIVEILQGRLYE